jgi:hypothetical protein
MTIINVKTVAPNAVSAALTPDYFKGIDFSL